MENKKPANKLNILFVITKSNFGGAQKYVFELATEMQNNGHNVSVALGGRGILKEKLEENAVKVIQISSLQRNINIFSEIKTFIELIKIFKKEKPDVIHLNSSKIGGLGSLAGRIAGINRIIFTIHGWAFNEDRNWFSKLAIKKIYWWAILMSHKSIVVSETTKKQGACIPFWFLIKNKIVVIKNEIQKIEFVSKEESQKFFSEKIGMDNLNEYKIIGGIHELHPIKGLDYLIDAAAEIIKENPKTIFINAGTGEEKENLTNKIKKLGLEKNFFLIGFVKDAAKYLKGFDIFTITSLSEALPLSLLEAKQANIPIVATRVGGIPEALENYPNCELIDSKNSNQIIRAINKAFSKDIKTNETHSNDFQKMINETLVVYKI